MIASSDLWDVSEVIRPVLSMTGHVEEKATSTPCRQNWKGDQKYLIVCCGSDLIMNPDILKTSRVTSRL